MENKEKRPVGRPRVAVRKHQASIYHDSKKYTHIQVSKSVHLALTKLRQERGINSINAVIDLLLESKIKLK